VLTADAEADAVLEADVVRTAEDEVVRIEALDDVAFRDIVWDIVAFLDMLVDIVALREAVDVVREGMAVLSVGMTRPLWPKKGALPGSKGGPVSVGVLGGWFGW
jgi:hypothetical protein